MKFSRNRRSYYLGILMRTLGLMVCIGLGVGAGVFYSKNRNMRESEKKRVYLCTLKRSIEAGQVIQKTDVEEVPVLREGKNFQVTTLNQCIGKRVKESLKGGCIIAPCMLSDKMEKEENTRKVPYTFVHNIDALKQGDSIDVRISFPNGADFVLLGKKEVIKVEELSSQQEGKLWLALTEEEILRMSSGVVDAYLSDGANIYAVIYMNEMQKASIVNYPVNEVVQELIRKDPNIVKIAQDEKTYELRDRIYKKTQGMKEGGIKKEKESLIYFD